MVVLSLVYFLYLDRTAFADGTKWVSGMLLSAEILARSGGFFVHMTNGGSVPAGPAPA
ncbi:MAG: hypothetical protein M3179_13385 [Actinomycetota bacterium]|nr:hypothetical protein [Actinomycetota bacterium]